MLQNLSIPQFIIQENFIVEGENNRIDQVIDQTLFFYPISLTQIEDSQILQVFLQNNFTEDENAEINQEIEQIGPDFSLFSNHDELISNKDSEMIPFNINVNDFLNNDGELNSIQLVSQQADILGNNNQIIQTGEQDIVDLRLLDFALLEDKQDQNRLNNIENLLNDVADEVALDSLQFAIQDVIIQGNENEVEQLIDQSIVTFLVFDEDIIDNVVFSMEELPPTQAIIQENFIGNSEREVNNNQINQEINQRIILDPIFSHLSDIDLEPQVGREANSVNFDIDFLIETILETSLVSTQRLVQEAVQTGNKNPIVQESNQDLLFINPGEVVFGNQVNDTLKADITSKFDGIEDILFAGKGNDSIEVSNTMLETVNIPTQNRVYGGSGNDHVLAKSDDRVFGGSGDDQLNASLGNGNNRLYGGFGNDILIAGNNDQLIGGNGDDQGLAWMGINNTLWGGPGSDEFWIANTKLPTDVNVIADFIQGDDQIRISNLNLTFDDLKLYQDNTNTIINIFDQDIAVVLNVSADHLQANDFLFT